jgi:hypothetical protein
MRFLFLVKYVLYIVTRKWKTDKGLHFLFSLTHNIVPDKVEFYFWPHYAHPWLTRADYFRCGF